MALLLLLHTKGGFTIVPVSQEHFDTNDPAPIGDPFGTDLQWDVFVDSGNNLSINHSYLARPTAASNVDPLYDSVDTYSAPSGKSVRVLGAEGYHASASMLNMILGYTVGAHNSVYTGGLVGIGNNETSLRAGAGSLFFQRIPCYPAATKVRFRWVWIADSSGVSRGYMNFIPDGTPENGWYGWQYLGELNEPPVYNNVALNGRYAGTLFYVDQLFQHDVLGSYFNEARPAKCYQYQDSGVVSVPLAGEIPLDLPTSQSSSVHRFKIDSLPTTGSIILEVRQLTEGDSDNCQRFSVNSAGDLSWDELSSGTPTTKTTLAAFLAAGDYITFHARGIRYTCLRERAGVSSSTTWDSSDVSYATKTWWEVTSVGDGQISDFSASSMYPNDTDLTAQLDSFFDYQAKSYTPTVLFDDNFDDADSTLITAHTPDTDASGAGWSWTSGASEPYIISNHCLLPINAVIECDVGNWNGTISGTFSSPGNASPTFIIRSSGGGAGQFIDMISIGISPDSDLINIREWSGGSPTTIASVGVTLDAVTDYSFTIEYEDDTITVTAAGETISAQTTHQLFETTVGAWAVSNQMTLKKFTVTA